MSVRRVTVEPVVHHSGETELDKHTPSSLGGSSPLCALTSIK